jgi:hypothetical protein
MPKQSVYRQQLRVFAVLSFNGVREKSDQKPHPNVVHVSTPYRHSGDAHHHCVENCSAIDLPQ